MTHTLITLPYKYSDLEPHMDAKTVEIHHSKHHQGYVNNLNAAIEKHPELSNKTLEELLKNLDLIPKDIKTAVRNNAGGTYSHNLFWQILSPNGGGLPTGEIANAINNQFESFEKFKEKFTETASKHFASGWVWLSVDSNKNLILEETPGHDTPLAKGLTPILVIDVWEHAYYLKHQNRRPEFISAWWEIINWDKVNENFNN